MMKLFQIAVSTLCLSVAILTVQPAYGVDLPEPKIKNARAAHTDQTAVQLRVRLKNFSENEAKSLTIRYHRDADEYETFTVNPAGYIYDNGKYFVTVRDLLPETTYWYRVEVSEGGDTIKNGWKKFKTTANSQLSITDIQPRTAGEGDKITITGTGFGHGGRVKVGYSYSNTAEVVTWSNNKITAIMPADATDGPVMIEAYPFVGTMRTYYALTATSDQNLDVENESHIYNIACQPGVIANTYEEIYNFNQLYQEGFGRSITCDELEFHLQHATPHDRLRTWLNEQDDGQWWDDVMEYDGEMVYGTGTAYYVSGGTLYVIPDVMTALAWGVDLDEGTYLSELNVDSSSNRYNVLSEADGLPIWKGADYDEVMAMSSDAFEGDDDTCEIMECGVVY